MFRRYASCVALTLFWFGALCQAQDFPLSQHETVAIELNEDHLLVLEVRIGGHVSDESLFVYQSPDANLIPIQALMDALSFPVTLDMDTLSFSGWFVHEAQRISIDFAQQRYFKNGLQQAWPERLRYAVDDFDLYVDQHTVENWFALELELDVPSLQLFVDSDQPLPILAQIEREKKRKSLRPQQQQLDIPDDYVPNEYDWWGRPQMDASVAWNVQRGQGEQHQDHSLIAQGRMDVLKHSMNLSVFESDAQREIRVRFERAASNPEEDLFAGFDSYAFGDVQGHSDPLLFTSVTGRGVKLSSGEETLQEQGSSLVIEGDGPPGWEVELYRNGNLLTFSEVEIDGRYRFEDVATTLGQNHFEIRLYGPQGQYRTSRKQVTIGGEMLADSEWEYQAIALERNANVFEPRPPLDKDPSAFFQADVAHGFNEHMTGQLGYSQAQPKNLSETRRYVYANLFTSALGFHHQLRLARDDLGGFAWDSTLKGRLDSAAYQLEWTQFSDLLSDRNPQGNLKSQLAAGVSDFVRFFLPNTIYYRWLMERSTFQDGRRIDQIENELSTSLWDLKLANDLVWTNSTLEEVERLAGTLSAAGRWHGWRVKGSASYRVEPETEAESASLGWSTKDAKRFAYSGTLQYIFGDEETVQLDNAWTWNFQPASITLSAGINSQSEQSLGLSLNTALSQDHNSNLVWTARSQVNNSRVTALVFLDENGDGVKGEDELPVENIRFKGQGHWRQLKTDEKGLVTLDGLPHLDFQQVSLDEKSIEDPFILPAGPAKYIYTHAGTSHFIQVPLVQTLELEGQLSLAMGDRTLPAQGVEVRLINRSGDVVATTQTEYDGVYLFEKIMPGSYFVEFDAAWLSRRKYAEPQSIQILAKGEEGVIFIEPVLLTRPDPS